jgi:hypothetical protein
MKDVCLKKMYSNIPVLSSGCLTGSVYHTKNSVSQKNIRKIHVKVVTKMIQYRKFPNNSSPVEEN